MLQLSPEYGHSKNSLEPVMCEIIFGVLSHAENYAAEKHTFLDILRKVQAQR